MSMTPQHAVIRLLLWAVWLRLVLRVLMVRRHLREQTPPSASTELTANSIITKPVRSCLTQYFLQKVQERQAASLHLPGGVTVNSDISPKKHRNLKEETYLQHCQTFYTKGQRATRFRLLNQSLSGAPLCHRAIRDGRYSAWGAPGWGGGAARSSGRCGHLGADGLGNGDDSRLAFVSQTLYLHSNENKIKNPLIAAM